MVHVLRYFAEFDDQKEPMYSFSQQDLERSFTSWRGVGNVEVLVSFVSLDYSPNEFSRNRFGEFASPIDIGLVRY